MKQLKKQRKSPCLRGCDNCRQHNSSRALHNLLHQVCELQHHTKCKKTRHSNLSVHGSFCASGSFRRQHPTRAWNAKGSHVAFSRWDIPSIHHLLMPRPLTIYPVPLTCGKEVEPISRQCGKVESTARAWHRRGRYGAMLRMWQGGGFVFALFFFASLHVQSNYEGPTRRHFMHDKNIRCWDWFHLVLSNWYQASAVRARGRGVSLSWTLHCVSFLGVSAVRRVRILFGLLAVGPCLSSMFVWPFFIQRALIYQRKFRSQLPTVWTDEKQRGEESERREE